jgi:hypothetical protein
MPPTKISPIQINTRLLFSVREILLSRGFEVVSEDSVEKLLITEENIYDEIWDKLYNIYFNNKLRTELKKVLYQKAEAASTEIIELLEHAKFINKYSRFDNTFEWFAGELMIRKFSAFSASYGITVKDIIRNSTNTESGDFDSLVVLRNTNLAYFECKAGSFDKSSILKCYERMLSLNCEYSILFCVEKINDEKIIWNTKDVKIPVVNGHNLNKINIKGRSHDLIYDLNNCYILDMTGNIENKIRTVLRINSAKINSLYSSITPGNETLEMLGYKVETIDNQSYHI